jgi:tRNA(fMet)-specific endonuclease VapC
MRYVLDTSIVIELCDYNSSILEQIADLSGSIEISIITHVELLSGLHADSVERSIRAPRLAAILQELTILAFDADCVAVYENIVAATIFSRRKILDRMIAAQALAADATLVTMNVDDFRDIPNLKLLCW